MKIINVKLSGSGEMPTKATEGSAGYDLYAPERVILYPMSYECIDLGVSIELPKRTCGIISHRSGLNSKYGVFAYGLIDSDYRGSLKVTLFNFNDSPMVLEKGDRIAQLKIEEIPQVTLRLTEELTETQRGDKGHGSTGM